MKELVKILTILVILCSSFRLTTAAACNANFNYEIDSLDGATEITDSVNQNAVINDFVVDEPIDSTYQDSLYNDSLVTQPTDSVNQNVVINDFVIDEPIDSTYQDSLYNDSLVTPHGEFSISGSVYGDGNLFNSGVIVLCQQMDEYYMPVDAEIINSGSYKFDQLLSGNYILYAIPNVFVNSDYLPTYFVNKIFWGNVDVLNVESNISSVDIHLVKNENVLNGICKIKGKITMADSVKKSNHMKLYSISDVNSDDVSTSIPIILSSLKGNVLGYTLLNSEGEFEFENIPYGEYLVYPEIPNLYNFNKKQVKLTSENPEFKDLEIKINANGIVLSVESIEKSIKNKPDIYYNNTTNELKVVHSFNNSSDITFNIVNLMGQIVYKENKTILVGQNEIVMNLNSLEDNFYIVNMLMDNKESFSYKFIK